ncbi:hypothetical protein Slin15195_G020350 [Septoria linicola]|uniref:Uncharacterized protein n=1 Tax=Septoria linicola TaxID=215465 RepID=A0A9Q9AQ11_9PEZI|nr:hypothetical protein Slin14017_G020420 [Septoria linicola]USW48716.1 hypothetical protein Slin15195_G020350 [Septoria linicola]
MSISQLQSLRYDQSRQIGQGNSFEEEIAWTTARCSRLLRTINSRVEAIRRLVRPDLRSSKTAHNAQTKLRKQKQPASVTDPAWVPNGTKKPKLRTYAAKKDRKVTRDVRSHGITGEYQVQKISLPSPFVRRVGNFDLGLDATEQSLSIKESSHHRQQRRKPYSHSVGIEDPLAKAEAALQGAFKSFLDTTRPQDTRPARGTSTFLATCLRQVPQYLDTFIENQEDGDCDAVESGWAETWGFFDDLLEVKGTSWEGLREVVRSQGINAIRRAVIDGTLRDDCTEALVAICRESAASPVAETLLHAWLKRRRCVTSLENQSLYRMARGHGAEGMHFRVLTRFVEQGSDRIESLLHMDQHIWNDLLRAVTSGAQTDALQFLQACIEHKVVNHDRLKPLDPRKERLHQNLIEVASKLWVMSFTSLLLDKTSVQGMQLQEELCRLAIRFSSSHHKALARLGACWSVGPAVLTALVGGPPSVAASSDALSRVYQHVARNPFHSREAKRSEQDFAVRLAADLSSLHTHEHDSTIDRALLLMREHIKSNFGTAVADVMRHIVTEIVTRRRTENIQPASPESDYLPAYLAENLPTGQTVDFPETPKVKPGRFGWDDGLCEWIAKTPFTQPPPLVKLISISDSETETPGKENLEPETPDVLARSVLKPRTKRKYSDDAPLTRVSSTSQRSPGSPQVVISRPAKRRTSTRLETKQLMDESEDELAT